MLEVARIREEGGRSDLGRLVLPGGHQGAGGAGAAGRRRQAQGGQGRRTLQLWLRNIQDLKNLM